MTAVLKVGHGRGFVVNRRRHLGHEELVITLAAGNRVLGRFLAAPRPGSGAVEARSQGWRDRDRSDRSFHTEPATDGRLPPCPAGNGGKAASRFEVSKRLESAS